MGIEIRPDGPTISHVDPDLLDGDIPSLLIYQVQSRAYTQIGREFYDPAFGFEAYRLDAGLIRRQDASLSRIHGWDYERGTISSDGRRIAVDVILRGGGP